MEVSLSHFSLSATNDVGSTAETFRFTLNFTALNYTVFHVLISINTALYNYIFLEVSLAACSCELLKTSTKPPATQAKTSQKLPPLVSDQLSVIPDFFISVKSLYPRPLISYNLSFLILFVVADERLTSWQLTLLNLAYL